MIGWLYWMKSLCPTSHSHSHPHGGAENTVMRLLRAIALSFLMILKVHLSVSNSCSRKYLFLPIFSWSLTTQWSSAPGSRGIPFRSHSKPWEEKNKKWMNVRMQDSFKVIGSWWLASHLKRWLVYRNYLIPNRVGIVLDDLCLLLGTWMK